MRRRGEEREGRGGGGKRRVFGHSNGGLGLGDLGGLGFKNLVLE